MGKDKLYATGDYLSVSLDMQDFEWAVKNFRNGAYIDGTNCPPVWPQVLRKNIDEKTERYHEGDFGKVTMLSGVMAGRLMVTFRWKKSLKERLVGREVDRHLTFIGTDEPDSGVGIQGMLCTPGEALDMVDQVLKHWDVAKFKPTKSASFL